MKSLLYILFVFAMVAGNTACEKGFEAMNNNPNTPDRSVVEPEMLLPGIIRSIANFQVNQSFNKGGVVMQHLAKIRGFEDDRYQWLNQSPGWDNYSTLRNIYNMYDLAAEKGEQENYMAIALILKSWVFSILTDSYGDIPYSEAIKGKEAVNHPTYDPQEAVYDGMLADLEKANSLLAEHDKAVLSDIMYNGNIVKWRKFANSLRLRMLMRISDRRDIAQAMTEIVANPVEYPLFTGNADNAVLKYLADPPNQFPLYTLRITDQAYHVLGKTLLDKLNGWHDPRREVFAKPTANSQTAYDNGTGPLEYLGIENGQTEAVIAARNPKTLSNIGANYYGLPNAADGKLMTYAELLFILAEAAKKGWIPGNAQEYYKNGVNASFAYYMKTPPAGYFDQEGIAWDDSRALELIGTQKWVDLYWNGYEAWFDWRRTNIPHLAPAIVNLNENKIPVRFMYPTEEQTFNEANYKAAVSSQGPDNINTRVWWDVD